jgi:hypothetical protein
MTVTAPRPTVPEVQRSTIRLLVKLSGGVLATASLMFHDQPLTTAAASAAKAAGSRELGASYRAAAAKAAAADTEQEHLK